MFEKEAVEIAYKFVEKGCVAIEENRARQDIKYAFQKGAEYGYNKAKEEWKKHFLQCSSPFCLDNFSEVKCYGELGNMAKKGE